MCYNPVNRAAGIEMSSQEIKHSIDLLTDRGCIWLTFTGGETFLRTDFFEFYPYAMKKGLICSIQSNGTLITKEIALKLSDNPPYILDISVYGASRQTYEAVTGVAKGFDACLGAIDNLLKVGIKPILKTTVIKQNKDDIPAIRAFADARGLDYVYDPQIHPRIDGDKSPQSLRISPQEAAEISFMNEKYHKSWQEYLQVHINQPRPKELVICSAARDGLWINPYGVLRICGIVTKPAYDLRQGGTFEEARDLFQNYIDTRKLKEDSPCSKCGLYSFCGQCLGWSQLENNDLNCKVDYVCQIAHLQEIKFKELGLWPKEVKTNVNTEEGLYKTRAYSD